MSQTLVQSRVMPGRAHDYLYDVNHTVAGRKDHVKAMMKAQTHDVLVQPSYDNMFSTLPHHPSKSYAIRTHNLPPYLGQDRRDHKPANPDVAGSNRFKYFRRPIIPYMPSLGTQIVYARRPVVVSTGEMQTRPVTPPTKTVAVQTMYRESDAQTDPYSPEYILHPSCNGVPPELLSLATLTYSAGLPVTMSEIQMIERARQKRAWEATLPAVTDQASFELRLKMMEEMEMREWKEREDEIRALQEARLEVLKKVIERREQKNEKIGNERVKRVWEKKLLERDAVLEKLERKKVKALRKLTDKRIKVEPKIERRDIISEYADYGSKVYAPKPRDGMFYDKPSSTLHIEIGELDDYYALQDLEEAIPPKYLEPNLALPKKDLDKRSFAARRELQLQAQLALMDQKLKERKMGMAQNAEDEKPLRFAQKIEKPPIRPPTPVVVDPRQEDEDMEVAAILLQKLIRGRLAQNMMHQGKERRLNLINELRTRQTIRRNTTPIHTTNVQSRISTRPVSAAVARATFDSLVEKDEVPVPDVAAAAGDAAAAEALEAGASLAEAVERALEKEVEIIEGRSVSSSRGGAGEELEDEADEEIIHAGEEPDDMPPPPPRTVADLFESNIQAEYVGKTLDFLTKELVRLREERRISAMVMLAERTRRMREAEESGRRQAELHRRNIEDEVFRQVMSIHQETVDSFLESVITGSVNRVASQQAREQVREYASRITEVVDELERRESDKDVLDRTIVSDLVASFLIPEVERQTLRNQVKTDQRKYLLAAHKAVYSELPAIETISRPQSSRGSSRPVSGLPEQEKDDRTKTSAPPSRPGSRAAGAEF